MRLLALWIFSTLLIATTARAEQIPDGCYVAFDNPNYCYVSYSGFYEWNTFGNRSYAQLKYGSAFEALLHQWNVRDIDATQASLDLSACNANYNSLLGSYNGNEANRQEWIAYGNSEALLLKRGQKI